MKTSKISSFIKNLFKSNKPVTFSERRPASVKTITVIFNPDNLQSLVAAARCKNLYDIEMEKSPLQVQVNFSSIRDTYNQPIPQMYIWLGVDKTTAIVPQAMHEKFKKAIHLVGTPENYLYVPDQTLFMSRIYEYLADINQGKSFKPTTEFEMECKIEVGEFVHYMALFMYAMYEIDAYYQQDEKTEAFIDVVMRQQYRLSRYYYKTTPITYKKDKKAERQKMQQKRANEIFLVTQAGIRAMKELNVFVPAEFENLTKENFAKIEKTFNSQIARTTSVSICTDASGNRSVFSVNTRIDSMYWLALRHIRMSRKYHCNFNTTRFGTMTTSNVPSYMRLDFANGHVSC